MKNEFPSYVLLLLNGSEAACKQLLSSSRFSWVAAQDSSPRRRKYEQQRRLGSTGPDFFRRSSHYCPRRELYRADC